MGLLAPHHKHLRAPADYGTEDSRARRDGAYLSPTDGHRSSTVESARCTPVDASDLLRSAGGVPSLSMSYEQVFDRPCLDCQATVAFPGPGAYSPPGRSTSAAPPATST